MFARFLHYCRMLERARSFLVWRCSLLFSRNAISILSSGSLESLASVSNACGDLARDRFATKKIREGPFFGSEISPINWFLSLGRAMHDSATASPSLGPLGAPISQSGADLILFGSCRYASSTGPQARSRAQRRPRLLAMPSRILFG